MAWIVRKAVGVSVGAIMLVVPLGMSPAIADTPCDVVLSAVVDGAHTAGDLELDSVWSSAGWSYSASVPSRYNLAWLDGTHRITSASAIVIGGGELTRSSSITGKFVHISACLVERDQLMAPVPL